MVRKLSFAFALFVCAAAARAEVLRVFGSAGAESQITPANESSPLNPNNVARIPMNTNVADAVIFADATPESRRWKLHAKLRADSSDRAADHLRVGEAFVQLNAAKWLDITAGRVIEKWGTGYAWNPAAFVSPAKNPSDPNDRRAAYRGLDMVRADVFVRGTNVSLYALSGGAIAARAYRLIGGTDVSLHLYRDDRGTKQGVSVARVFGDALEVHAEVARRHALLGGQYTFPANINVVVELYRSGEGLDARQWRAFRDAIAPATLLRSNLAFAPLQMARNYSFVRVDAPFGANDLELIDIMSLRDRSSIVRATFTRKLHANLSAYVIDTEFLGRDGSELALVQVKRVVTFGARVFF